MVHRPLSRSRPPADLSGSRRIGSVPPVPIRFENVEIAVRDREATIALSTDLGFRHRP